MAVHAAEHHHACVCVCMPQGDPLVAEVELGGQRRILVDVVVPAGCKAGEEFEVSLIL